MNTVNQSQRRQVLLSRRHAIADSWRKAVAQSSYVSLDEKQVRDQFAALTEQVIAVLLAEPFDHGQAQAIGASLAGLNYLEPEALGQTQEVLSRQLVQDLLADQVVALQPRLGALLGELANGFFQQAREKILGEQEKIRGAHIAAREQLKEAPREREEGYHTLFDRAPVGLYRTTLEGQMLDANPALVQMLGYADRQSLLEVNVTDVYLNPDHRRQWQTLMEREGVVPSFECQVRRRDGAIIWVQDTARAIYSDAGQVLYYEGAVEDITERKQMEKSLQESEERYRRLVELSPDAIVVHCEGKLVFANPAAVEMSGARNVKEIIGRPVLGFSHPDFHAIVKERVRRALEQGVPAPLLEEKLIRLDGTITDVEVAATPLVYQGKPAMQIIVRDITERKRVEEELRQLNRELEDSNRGLRALYAELERKAEQLQRASEVKSHFLSHVSHELRTPLDSIVSISQILLRRFDGNLTAEQEKQVTLVHDSARELLGLIGDLLDTAKVEAGRMEVHPAEFEVPHLFSGLRGMMETLDINPQIELIFEQPVDIPPLHTDQVKVTQILRNLISNALKFTERGEVRVSAKLDDDGRAVIISVADTGVGIAPEDQERIFEEFVQAAAPVQRGAKGTGLGLALSRKLAELLGGSLTAESAPGVGAAFTAVIPLAYAGEGDTK